MKNNETIMLTKINLYGEKVTREIKVGDMVIRKDIGGFWRFDGLLESGKAGLYDEKRKLACATTVDNLRF